MQIYLRAHSKRLLSSIFTLVIAFLFAIAFGRRIYDELFSGLDFALSYDVAFGSGITPCNKIDKPLVEYGFTGNDMTSITTLRTQ